MLINSYLAFCFLLFSMTTLLQIGVPLLPINSSKRKSLFESQSLSQVLLRIWFILGACVRLFSTENYQGIGGLSCVKVPGVNGLNNLCIGLFKADLCNTLAHPLKKKNQETVSSACNLN